MTQSKKNSIRVKSATEYGIEVNDKGEMIFLDSSDSNLMLRMIESFEKIDQLQLKYENKAKEIDKRQDEPVETFLEGDFKITKNLKEGCTLLDQFYKEAREAMDLFLGEGACQKIFGDKNYAEMFNDLAEQLKPHLEKMGLNAKQLREKALNKHGLNRQQRRALK